MTKYMVAPSILSGDFANMGDSVRKACEWGADLIHVDVMDGVYVPNITFGMPMVSAIKPYSSIPLDVHLMITEPEKYVGKFVDNGADIVTFHPEASKNVLGAIETIKSKGAKCGLALNPDKPLDLVCPYLDKIDMVLLMSVFPGFGGQKFIESVLDKAKELKSYIDKNNLNIDIEIDGGVSSKNAQIVRDSGVNILVAGSAVYKSDCPKTEIEKIRGN
ncbi:MAG: ribulose-phosphate 3-epimerase [Clostridia bacterium]|nr:ribulose-phosphate 3-epimerase [Clostridia bacterium]